MDAPSPCEMMGGGILSSPPQDDSAIASMIAHVVHCEECRESPQGKAFLDEFNVN